MAAAVATTAAASAEAAVNAGTGVADLQQGYQIAAVTNVGKQAKDGHKAKARKDKENCKHKNKAAHKANKEGKCGEGKCGEGKCGEGKCGGKK